MPKIQVVTDEILRRAKGIGNDIEKILGSQNKVTNIFQNMGRSFSGKVPNLMTQHMIAMESDYKAMNAILSQYKTFMEDTAHNYEWTDEEGARWAQALAGR